MSGMNIEQIFATAQVWAAGAGQGAEHHAPSIHDIWFPLGNFLIFAWLIVKYVFPLVRGFLSARREEVIATIAQSSAKKQQAEAFVNDYKTRIAGLDREIASMQAALRDEGEQEKARLVHAAQEMAAKIKQDAQFLADQEVKIARQQIRQEMANQAETAACELIQRHLSPADQNRLAEEFIQNIGSTR